MSSTPPPEIDLSQVYQELATSMAQVDDAPTLFRMCASCIDSFVPGASYAVVWDAGDLRQTLHSHNAPALAAPDRAQLARLQRGELIDEGRAGICWLPLRFRDELRGWIQLSPADLHADQITALGLLVALLTPTLIAFLPDPIAEARIARLRTLNEIGQVLSGVLRIEDLPEAIYAGMCRVLDAPHFTLALYDDALQSLRPLYLVNGHASVDHADAWITSNGLMQLVVAERTPLHIEHYLDECVRRNLQPNAHLEAIHNNAWMGAPILAQDKVLGIIAVGSDRPNYRYTDEHLEVLQTIAAQTSVALANAQLYERAARQTRQLDSLNRIGRSITSTLDSERVPSLIMQHVQELLEAEEGSLLVLDEASGDLIFAFAGGPTGSQLIGQRLPRGIGIAGNVFSTARSTIVNDVREDRRFYANTDSQTGFTTQRILATPLRGVAGVQGVMEVVNKRGGRLFTKEDVSLIEAAADQAVIALENARRFAQVDQALAQRARELAHTNSQLREILQVGNALRVEDHLHEVLWQVAQAVSRSTGFRRSVIALVQRQPIDQPYLQRVATSDGVIHNEHDRAPLQVFTDMLHPAFQRGPATYLLDHRSVDYFALWSSDERPAPPSEPTAPGDWDPQDVLITVLLDNAKNLLGFLKVQDPVDRRLPTPDQVQILEIFANQAAVAIENMRLYEDQAHSLRSLTTLNELGMSINTLIQAEEEIFRMMAQSVIDTSGALGACVLLNQGYDPDDTLALASAPLVYIGDFNVDPSLVRRQALKSLSSNRPEVLNNGDAADAPGSQRTLVTVPLRATHNTLGVLCVSYGETLPPAADLEMLALFAGQAAAAAANLRLWRAVSRGRDQLASIMTSTHDGIVLIDPSGQIAVANNALYSLCGLNSSLERQSLTCFLDVWASASNYPQDEWEQLHEGLRAVTNNEQEIVYGQLNQLTPRPRSVEWTTLAARDEGRRNEGLLLIIRDITDAKETERLRQDLTNMIVHDMRSPLTSVMTSIDMLFKGVSGTLNETQQSILTIAYTSSQQMLEMVNMMLDISRLESGRMPLNRMPQPLGALIRRATNRLSPQARNKTITIKTDDLERLPLVYADGELIVRVLQNLVDNALKFSGHNSTITIRATLEVSPTIMETSSSDRVLLQGDADIPMFVVQPHQVVKIAVIDQGIGIDPTDLAKIFDKFGQVGERRSGTGLGLTFCKLVTEAHGGVIDVTSIPKKGSTFFFTLPLVLMDGEVVST